MQTNSSSEKVLMALVSSHVILKMCHPTETFANEFIVSLTDLGRNFLKLRLIFACLKPCSIRVALGSNIRVVSLSCFCHVCEICNAALLSRFHTPLASHASFTVSLSILQFSKTTTAVFDSLKPYIFNDEFTTVKLLAPITLNEGLSVMSLIKPPSIV